MSLLKEFKDFAMKGNMVDMALGIIIGVSFGKIISSLVKDVIMPPIGILIGGVDFSNLAITIQEAVADTPAVLIAYGKFIQTLIDFSIIALAIFFTVKVINKMKKKEEKVSKPPPKPSTEEVLLGEIRDLLKARNQPE